MAHTDVLPIDDVDGAFAETCEGATGRSRRELLRDVAVGGGLGGALPFGGFTGRAEAQGRPSRRQDLQILQFSLVAEYLGSSFYGEALRAGRLEGETLRYARTAKRDEDAHVVAVRALIRERGGRPRPRPRFDFQGIPADPQRFRETSLMIENMCVRVLNGAGPYVTKPVLAAAGALVSVEARQAAWMALILGQNPAPLQADAPLRLTTAAERVAATGFVVDQEG